MRLQNIDQLAVGEKLGRALFDDEGRTLVNRGMALTPRVIEELKRRNFFFVYVADEETEDIEVVDAVTDQTATRTLHSIQGVMDGAGQAAAKFRDKSPEAISAALEDQRLADELIPAGALRSFMAEAEQMVAEVMDADVTAGLNTIKTHHAKGHSVALHSAIASVVIGKRLRLNVSQLHALSVGTMLHDIGLSALNPEFVEADEMDLSAEDFARYREHPQVGFRLLRGKFGGDMQPSQIAYQHHERQDGTGYPRGLFGINTIERSVVRKGSGEQIHLLAEVAAVGILYAVLSNGTHRHAALPPDQVRLELVDRSGTTLNSEILQGFLLSFPMFPVGTEVQIKNGKSRNFTGMVSEVSRNSLDRPVVRILKDPAGKKVKPFDLDLRSELDVEVAGIAEQDGQVKKR